MVTDSKVSGPLITTHTTTHQMSNYSDIFDISLFTTCLLKYLNPHCCTRLSNVYALSAFEKHLPSTEPYYYPQVIKFMLLLTWICEALKIHRYKIIILAALSINSEGMAKRYFLFHLFKYLCVSSKDTCS